MKKFITLLLAAILLTCACASADKASAPYSIEPLNKDEPEESFDQTKSNEDDEEFDDEDDDDEDYDDEDYDDEDYDDEDDDDEDYDDEDYDDEDYDDEDYDDVDYDAFVKATGNVNVRSGPGLEYDTINSLNKGSIVEFAGVVCEDDRGVDWYKIYIAGGTGWVSSRYSDLTADEYEYISYYDEDDEEDEEDDEDTEEASDETEDETEETWSPIIEHTAGKTYDVGLSELNASFNYNYGKSGFVYQITDNIYDEGSLDYSSVPTGNLGGLTADLDHDGSDELIVVGQSDDRLLTIEIYEATAGGSELKDRCVFDVSTIPMCSEVGANGMKLDVFLFENNSVGIAFYDLMGLRGDGTTVTFIKAVYDGSSITVPCAGTLSGSAWEDMEDCELIKALKASEINTTIDAVMSGNSIVDMVSDKTYVGGMYSQNLLTYDQLAKGKAVADVTVNPKQNTEPDFVFSFQ